MILCGDFFLKKTFQSFMSSCREDPTSTFCSVDQSVPNQSRHVVDSGAWKPCCRLTRWWKLRYSAQGPTWHSVAPGHVKLHNYPTVNDSKHLPCSCFQTQTCLSIILLNYGQSSRNKALNRSSLPCLHNRHYNCLFVLGFILQRWHSRFIYNHKRLLTLFV